MNQETPTHCGYVAIVGRPNVGKSTLLNRLLKQKLSITSRKPQTTRHHILGVNTQDNTQVIYVDTPGLQINPGRTLNRYMNREVTSVVADVDLILFVIEAQRWDEQDDNVLKHLQNVKAPVLLVINKVDKLADRALLLPLMENLQTKMQYLGMVPICARRGEGVEQIESLAVPLMPEGPFYFPEDQLTDRSERFLAAEMIREKLMRKLGDEIPYQLSVMIDEFKMEDKVLHINSTIWVERAGQKNIVIGKKGSLLKAVGEEARHDMQEMFGKKIFLTTWVKVKEKWSDNARSLQQMGFDV